MNFKAIIKKNRFFRFIFNKWRKTGLSIHKTIIYNLISLPFRDAIKFPIWIYQDTQIEHIGNIKIDAPICTGMIRIGKKHFFRNSKTTFINNGTIRFYGYCTIMGGCTIHVLGNNSILILGKEVMIGENSKVLIGPNIEIGDYTRIAFESLLMSADFHYLINITTRQIKRNMGPIIIGKYNWIGNNSIIKKGTITPDYCIVSNNTMLTKDYSDYGTYTLISGIPGRVKDNKYRRIYNNIYSSNIDNYFKEHNVNDIMIPIKYDDPYYEWLCKEDTNVHIH